MMKDISDKICISCVTCAYWHILRNTLTSIDAMLLIWRLQWGSCKHRLTQACYAGDSKAMGSVVITDGFLILGSSEQNKV